MAMKFQPQMSDFFIGAGGGGLMPNAATKGKAKEEWLKKVEKDLKRQARAKPRTMTAVPGKRRSSGPVPLV